MKPGSDVCCAHGIDLAIPCPQCEDEDRTARMGGDLPLFAPGSKTSRAAARSVARSVGKTQRIILEAYESAGFRGLTVDELMTALREPPKRKNTIAPRVSGLKEAGKLVDSGMERPSNLGQPACVLVLPKYRKKNGQ